MREIKFRAWNDDLKRMGFSDNEHFKTPGWWGVIITSKEDLGEIVMQYTGLKDKNGTEIYEGDIVKYKEVSGFGCEDEDYKSHGVEIKPSVVEFIDGTFSPRERYNYCEDGFYAWRNFDFEVIGNIYENPELLK